VGAGYLTAAEGDVQGAAIAAVLSQLVLTVVYAAYDKYLKPYILKLLGLAVTDVVNGR
jgi:Na+-driven multidrug efflux pump